MAVIVVVVIVILGVVFLPLIPVTYSVQEPKERTETYWEKEPRQRTETYWEKEPYQVTKAESSTLISDKPTVSAGQARYLRIYIDISGKDRNVIYGSVVETAGYDINFYVFDQKGFNAWQDGRSAAAYVSAQRIRTYDYSFVPDHSDYYFFVLDNRYSWFTNKVPSITATWNYQVIVTEYRDVQKTRTVTEYVDVQKTRTVTEYVTVTKTKQVSIYQLLTGASHT